MKTMLFRIFNISVIVLVFSTSLNAQVLKSLDYGVVVSGNTSHMIVKSNQVYSSLLKPAFEIGVFLSMQLENNFSVRSELKYSTKGSNLKDEDDKGKNVLNYIKLPVYINYNPADRLILEAGPYLAYLLSGTEKDWSPEDADLKEYMKSIDIGWSLGVGYQASDKLRISFRFSQGLTNLLKKEFRNDNKVTNQVLGLTANYRLFP